MSYYDYKKSQTAAANFPFYALLMAAMREADTYNAEALKRAFPAVWEELQKRYHAPGGCLTFAEFQQNHPEETEVTEHLFNAMLK